MAKIKPTHKEPISPQSQEFEKDFKKAMTTHNLNIRETQEKLNEIDGMLSEAEQSLKKKIFSLPKMEALVFSDPKLSAVYDEMAENGEEKYGYHYNETIMNMIFNDYVLNSSQYLQKYKNAIPKEKKRRDKSGINQLKKAGQKKMDATGTKIKDKSSKEDVDETTSASSAGGAQGYVGYAGPAAWSKKGDIMGNSKKEDYKIRKPIANITSISESNYLTDSSGFEKYIELLNEEIGSNFEQAKAKALRISKEEGVAQHVNQISDDVFTVSDWYDSDSTVVSFENGRELNEINLQEKAKSKSQQKFMGMVHAYQKGELKDGEVSDSVKKAAESMTDKEAEDFASTKHKGLPEKIDEELYDKISKVEFYDKTGQLQTLDGEKIPLDQLNTAEKPIKLTFVDGSEERVSYDEFMQVYSHNDDNKLNINEYLSLHDTVEYLSDRSGEEPFMMGDTKWQFVNARYPDGKIDIGVYKFGHDLVYDYSRWREEYNINEYSNHVQNNDEMPEKNDYTPFSNKNIKEDTQTMIQNNGTSMSNKSQPTGDMGSELPMGTQQTGGLNEFEEFTPHGSYTVSNTGGYEVMLNDSGDAARVRDAFGSDNPEISDWLEIEYIPTENGEVEPVIDPNGYNIPLNQVMRLNEQVKMKIESNLLETINKELEAFSIHHDKLKMMSEERKTNSQILNARVGDENEKNFKKDFKNSDTKDIINVEKELQYKDQQTDVKDPQKLGNKIEKQEIKNADMKSNEALKNVGNSTNDNGDEVPKRNLTSDEQEEVNMFRNGQHSIVYDNEPDERFVERQKADQGEFFDIGEKQKEFKATAPTYNKDSQPVDDSIEKSQYNKNKSGWNEREGLKESMITGRYIDILGKRRLMEFRLNEVTEVKELNEDNNMELSFDGLGNTYLNKSVNKKVVVNETVVNAMNKHKFYTDGKSVFAVKKSTTLNESDKKEEKSVVNEDIDKMKHLLGYKPDSFVNTNNVKKNRGF